MPNIHVSRSTTPATAHRVGPAYRVGLGNDLARLRLDLLCSTSWAGHSRALTRFAKRVRGGVTKRIWWGLWQAEHDGPERFNARRGLTPQGARGRMILDVDRFDRGLPQRIGILRRKVSR